MHVPIISISKRHLLPAALAAHLAGVEGVGATGGSTFKGGSGSILINGGQQKCRDCDETRELARVSSGLDSSTWLCLAHRVPVSLQMEQFKYGHLPPHLQVISQPFAQVAAVIDQRFGEAFDSWWRGEYGGWCFDPKVMGPLPALHLPIPLASSYLQKEQALTDLLRSKDAAVRAVQVVSQLFPRAVEPKPT